MRISDWSSDVCSSDLLHNCDGQPRQNADEIRRALHEQLFRPVRWSATIARLKADGVSTFLECGPGKVLVGLNKRIVKELSSIALEDADGMDKAMAAVKADRKSTRLNSSH